IIHNSTFKIQFSLAMSDRLRSRSCIVTGAATGIGEAIAHLMAEEGGRVAVVDVDEVRGEATAAAIREAGGEAIFIRADVSQEEEVARMTSIVVETFGGVDVLVNNAAVFVLKGVEATAEDWERSLRVNVIGNSLCTRYAAEEMKKRGGGAIVNLSSISGFIAQPHVVTYSAAKAAILQMTRTVALDLAPFNIRVNAVCPGTILTQAPHSHMERVG